jgi:hypothetical protein
MGGPIALAMIATALAVAPAYAAARRGTALQQYVAAMSWPVRASVLRAQAIREALDCAVSQGDPPCWREVAGRCRGLRAVEERWLLLRIAAPPALRVAMPP